MRKLNAVPARIVVAVAALLALGALPVSAQVNDAAPQVTQAIKNSQLTVLHGNVNPMARPAYDRGLAPASLPMGHMLLVLKRSPQQEAALETLLAQQQDRKSSNYHKWLTPAQFGAQFGPSDQDIATITSWLQSQGFTVNGVSTGRTVIDFSGTAATVATAFHTAIHSYVLPNGKQHWANSTDPEIPAALAPVVAGVRSLNNFFPKPNRVSAVHPAFTYPSQYCATGNCFDVTPADFDTIYNVPPTATGAGETIAIVSDSDVSATDLQQFRSMFGLTAMTAVGPTSDPTGCPTNGSPCFVQLVPPGSSDPGIQCPEYGAPFSPATCTYESDGDETEAALDVEWAGAPAPSANIWLVASADIGSTTFGGDLSATYIVNCTVTDADCPVAVPASVVSTSYGDCEYDLGTIGNQFYDSLWQQATAEGITVVASAGDSGSAGCDYYAPSYGLPQPAEGGLAVDGTASTPYDVAVGGTDFNDYSNPTTYWNLTNSSTGGSAKGYIPETTWNDSCTNTIFGNNAISNCNNANLDGSGTNDALYIWTIGGSGGKSSCTTSDFNTTNGTGSESTCADPYPKPSWQTGTGVPNDGVRDLPDVSMFASNGFLGNSYIECEADTPPGNSENPPGQGGEACSLSAPPSSSDYASFEEIGGTSVAVQVFGGIVVLMDQVAQHPQGNINPLLYSLAAQSGNTCASAANPASTCVFYDVTTGTISQPCNVSGTDGYGPASPDCTGASGDPFGVLEASGQLAYNAGTGYDLATGLGSVNVGNLLGKWPTTPSFILSSVDPYVTLANSSSSGTVSFSVVSENGFSGTIDFSSSTCSGLPSGFTCSISPSPATLSAGGSVTETLTIQPTSGGSAIPTKLRGIWTSDRLAISAIPLCCLLALPIFALGYSKRIRLLRWAAFAVVLVGLAAAAGCSGGAGGSSPGGTSPNTSTAILSVVAGGQTQTMNFNVTLN